MEDFSICFDWDAPVPAISHTDAALLTCTNVVIGRVEPLIGVFVESRPEAALAVGYDSVSAFIEMFRTMLGTTTNILSRQGFVVTWQLRAQGRAFLDAVAIPPGAKQRLHDAARAAVLARESRHCLWEQPRFALGQADFASVPLGSR
jgi:hypothetical protein